MRSSSGSRNRKHARESPKWYWSWWQYRRVHARFGWKFWSFVVGAAPLDPELEDFWRKLGFVVIQGYGLTETAPVATLNHPFETKKGSVGKAIGGVEIRIAQDGEVLLRGENVTPGYYGQTGSGILDDQGWLRTGDLGELDAGKRLKILGRKKEVIVGASGLNVYPEDVERVLNGILGVRESAVVASKTSSGELVHAVLVLDDGVEFRHGGRKRESEARSASENSKLFRLARRFPAAHLGHQQAEAHRSGRMGEWRSE